MAMYAFRGRSGGAVVSGEIEANDRPTAVTALRARGVVATSVQERLAKPVGIKKIGGKVKGAIGCPVTIISVAVLVIVFMMIFVIPTFAKMFQGLGADLPLPTKIVMFLSEFTQRYILVMIGVGAGIIYGIKRYYNTEQGSNVIDAFLLKVPVIGMLIRKVAVARFTRTLGTLISSGVPILEGL